MDPHGRAPHAAQSVPERFEEQVRAHGPRVAIQSEHASLTYDALDRLANGLARAIHARLGAGAEPIALLFGHGADVVAAIIAVLKLGKFYVVMDASNPRDRLRYILADSQARLIVADDANLELAREIAHESIGIVGFAEHARYPSDAIVAPAASPGDLALLIYTSGSTGRPKGVMHTHRNVLADTQTLASTWDVSPDDRWLWHTSIGFAGSARTIYGALLNGSAVHPYDSKRKSFSELSDWVLRQEITIFRTVPTTFRSFMATLPDDLLFPSVRIVWMGGEPLFRADVDAFNRHFSAHAVLVHPFAPTESMAVCWNVLRHGEQIAGNKVPIGRPLPNTTVTLLDEAQNPVADPAIGEIAVKSPYLSPGYWRDADRTKAVFLPDERGGDERTYLTGDLGMRLPDGSLMHMGRRDFQVKIRGFRIELSEIETALRSMEGIRDAVVVGSPIDAGLSRLVAYFVPASSPGPTVTDIRAHLAQSLPDYMVPSVFVAMDVLPQTPTGKTDRLHLPAVAGTRPEMVVPFAPASNRVEEQLTQIWSDVLGLDRPGIHDDFFELGGDSLLGLKVLSRVEQTFRTPVSLKELFEAPTIAGQSARLGDRRDAPARASLVEVRPPADALEASRPPLLISPSLFGHIGEWRELMEGASLDRAVFGIEFHGNSAYQTEHPTLEEIVSEVANVVVSQFPNRLVHLAGHSFGGHVAYELGQQLRARSVAPLSVVLVDANAYAPERPLRTIDVVSMAANFPRWLTNEWRVYGPAELWKRVKRHAASRTAISTAVQADPALASAYPRSLNRVMRTFDWSSLPTLYQQRLLQSYTAILNYRPRPTENRVVYVQSRVRNLIHRHRPDGGWSRYVPHGSLETHLIPGDHGSALQARWRPAFLAMLRQALGPDA